MHTRSAATSLYSEIRTLREILQKVESVHLPAQEPCLVHPLGDLIGVVREDLEWLLGLKSLLYGPRVSANFRRAFAYASMTTCSFRNQVWVRTLAAMNPSPAPRGEPFRAAGMACVAVNVPAFSEAVTVVAVIKAGLVQFLVQELVAVNDGSSYETRDVLQPLARQDRRCRLWPGVGTCEVAVSYDSRAYAEGKKAGWRDGISALRRILKYNLFSCP